MLHGCCSFGPTARLALFSSPLHFTGQWRACTQLTLHPTFAPHPTQPVQLTVYETLYFSAMLRLPRTWTKEAKMDRVEMVLEALGLQKCRDTIIGNAQMRGVSGGVCEGAVEVLKNV